MDGFLGVHADELSRRIGELDLNSQRRPSITQPESGSRYTIDELNGLRPEQEKHGDQAAPIDGVKTPPEIPAPPPSPHNEPGSSDGALGDIDTNTEVPGKEQIKKKKKKTKSSGKNKKPAPTGFEEFYADAPITPGEHDEESEVYATTNPFHDRIQACIQRYRKRRNLDSTRSNILTKYLMLGGVEASTTKQFTGGLDKDTLDNSTAREIAAIQATDFIRSGHNSSKYYDPANPEFWVIDFEGVAKGFFSSTAPKRLPTETEQEIRAICGVIRNFLNYILLHEVCPEYTDDVMAARKICNLAEKELWNIRQLRSSLPGKFNMSASMLYGVAYKDYSGEFLEETDSTNEDHEPLQGMRSIREAERTFKTGIAFEGSEELFLAAMGADINTIKREKKFVELVRIDRAEATSIREYSKVKNPDGIAGAIHALGRIFVKPWVGPKSEAEDLTDDEDEGVEYQTRPSGSPLEEFWLEDHLLELCFIGMKLDITAHELDIGMKFIDEVHTVYCSFHTVLPNEKVLENWKEPVPNTRPAPTEENPDVEENAMDAEMEREMQEHDKQFEGEKNKLSDPKSTHS